MQPLSLRANFSWTLVGNVVYAASQWGMLVVLAKLGTPEMVGQFALGLAVTAPVYVFANLALRAVQATDASRSYPFYSYLTLRIITTLAALVFVMGSVGFGNYQSATALIILAMGLARGIESQSDIYHGLLQQRERMDLVATSLMIKGPLSLAGLATGVWLTGEVVWGTVGLAASSLLLLLLYDRPNASVALNGDASTQLRPKWDWRSIGSLAWLALPLGIVDMLYSLDTNLPRYVIERKLGEAELGVFAAVAYVTVAGNLVVRALGQSVSPRLSQYFAAGRNRAFVSLLLRAALVATTISLCGLLVAMFAGEWLLTVLYSAEYASHDHVFALLMIASGIAYFASLLSYGTTAMRQFKVQAVLFLVVALTTAALSLIFVPKYGLLGAAWALMISASVRLVGSLAIVLRLLNNNSAASGLCNDSTRTSNC